MPSSASNGGRVRAKKERRHVAFVEGDVTIDYHIATSRGPSEESYSNEKGERVPYAIRGGGASLLGELIESVAREANPNWLVSFRPGEKVKEEGFPRLFTAWYQYAPADEPRGWRVSKFLGTDSAQSTVSPHPHKGDADLLIIDDKRHFRSTPDWWKRAIDRSKANSWFLIRTGQPLEDEGMWQALRDRSANVIVLTTADDIRSSAALVTRGLSWERAAQDLYLEILDKKGALLQFSGCDFIIVNFKSSAAVIIENPQRSSQSPAEQQRREHQCWLIYNPTSLEDEEDRSAESGEVFGYSYCLLAAIANYLFRCLPDRPPQTAEMIKAIKNGLDASRTLYEHGYEMATDGIRFPVEPVVKEVSSESSGIWGIVKVPHRSLNKNWTLFGFDHPGGLETLAKEIVVKGLDNLPKNLPFFKVGDLVVADRREIEGFRNIQRLLREYARPKREVAKPLSIAIFGPPGSGKSFGIQQLAKSEMGGVGFASLTFNLSQLTTPEDLRGAFHQIRDKSLSGKMPLVFWDEFDSKLHDTDLGWLRFFLSPMQDGRFRESQVEHFIGRAIFIFAGGTEPTMEKFLTRVLGMEDARAVKAPDFVSRLEGYLDILGPNPSPSSPGEDDALCVVRRAIILHSQLKARKLGKIDDGVLNALLHVKEYKHGVRSMEAVIRMSPLSGRDRFERSSLPLEAQLNLHVDGKEFLELLRAHP